MALSKPCTPGEHQITGKWMLTKYSKIGFDTSPHHKVLFLPRGLRCAGVLVLLNVGRLADTLHFETE